MKSSSAKQFPLLVFDWDGTLVDSIGKIVNSLQHASREGIGAEISEQHARSVIGLGLDEAVSALHPELDKQQHAEDLLRIADAYRQHYIYDNDIPAPMFDGVANMLNKLREEGYTLAVATGKSRKGLDHTLKEHDMVDMFSITRTPTEARSKPDPLMLNEIIHETGFSATQTLMIGDSEHDLSMAKNANVASIAVTHGVHNRDTLEKLEPLACFDHITALHPYLQESINN